MSRPLDQYRVGILGAGFIFGAYARGLREHAHLPIVRVADAFPERAKTAAAEWGIPAYGDADALFADPDVDIVVNITTPDVHSGLSDAAMRAGKHVYVEKPLAVTLSDARENLTTAKETGRLLGSAPDTFLGAAGQTARAAIDAGLIGDPFAATSFVRSSRPQLWHPDPTFLFQRGAGPVLDWGPYHVAALVNLLGPITQVIGASSRAETDIAVTAPDRRVDSIHVGVDTHSTAILRFASGALATTMYSFDVWDTELPHIEIYGTEGTLLVPNPDQFDNPVLMRRRTDEEWSPVPVTLPESVADKRFQARGLGVADLAGHISGEPHRASGAFAYHVLEVLDGIADRTISSPVTDISSTVERPAARA